MDKDVGDDPAELALQGLGPFPVLDEWCRGGRRQV